MTYPRYSFATAAQAHQITMNYAHIARRFGLPGTQLRDSQRDSCTNRAGATARQRRRSYRAAVVESRGGRTALAAPTRSRTRVAHARACETQERKWGLG